MWIKICGNTNLHDARLAANLGADALGFIFAPSKRRVTPAEVAAITPHLPPEVERVGVFQSHTAAEIAGIVRLAHLTAVQIHGAPDPASPAHPNPATGTPDLFALAGQLHSLLGNPIRLIQTLHWTVAPPATPNPAPRLQAPPEPHAAPQAADADAAGPCTRSLRSQIDALANTPAIDRILIDSRVGAATGGTGVPFDWQAARAALSAIPPHLRLILAGGLTPENVGEAIRTLHPWGVDAVTGIESSPGRKDAKRLAAFIEHARA